MELRKIINELKGVATADKKEAEFIEEMQARIMVSTLSYNNSVVIMDEKGESHTPPVPDPVEEEFLVRKGDRVKGFEVSELTTNFIVLKSLLEYTEGKDSTPKTQFIIEKGECVTLNVYGLYDAVQRTSIKYIETVR